MYHGGSKLIAGPDVWSKVGLAMGNLGITFFSCLLGIYCFMH
jgi:hypothetical protein